MEKPATIAGILGALSSKRDEFFFVQIGAYDGQAADPIQAFILGHRWRGILVEPQSDAFERLRRNYAGSPGLIFENVAIADHEGSLPLYRLRDEFAHMFEVDHRMVSSFDPKHVIKFLPKQVDTREAFEIDSGPVPDPVGFAVKYGVHSLGLLQIDAEGYDYQKLKMVDFRKIKPQIICFEHMHLSAIEKGECIQLLVSQNYKVVTGSNDMIAFQPRYMYA